MEIITHRSACDDIIDGISTTYCGLIYDISDDILSNEPTCEECKKLMAL